MRELLGEIERALRARGWSARQASMEAVGTPEMISDMRRGRVPSVERIQALCEVLGLEFYIGPSRSADPVDAARLARAMVTADRGLESCGRVMKYEDRARVVSAIYNLLGEMKGPADPDHVISLIEAVAESPGSNESDPAGGL